MSFWLDSILTETKKELSILRRAQIIWIFAFHPSKKIKWLMHKQKAWNCVERGFDEYANKLFIPWFVFGCLKGYWDIWQQHNIQMQFQWSDWWWIYWVVQTFYRIFYVNNISGMQGNKKFLFGFAKVASGLEGNTKFIELLPCCLVWQYFISMGKCKIKWRFILNWKCFEIFIARFFFYKLLFHTKVQLH